MSSTETRTTETRKPAPPATCRGCDSTWTGLSYCHCSRCHETFAGVEWFDRHQISGRRGGAQLPKCIPPGDLTRKDGSPLLRLDDQGIWRNAQRDQRTWP